MPGRVAVAGEVLASPVAIAGEALASPGGRVLAWEGMLPSSGRVAVAREALDSLGRRVLAWEGILPSPAGGVCLGSDLINLTACLYS